jgi:hypothetical protein
MKTWITSVLTAFLLVCTTPHIASAWEVTIKDFQVTVPYRGPHTIQKLLEQGKYDVDDINMKGHPNITDEHFPQSGFNDHEITMLIVDFSFYNQCHPTTIDVLQEFEKRGLRAANTAEVLAFGIQYAGTEELRYKGGPYDVVVALGQTWADPALDMSPRAVHIHKDTYSDMPAGEYPKGKERFAALASTDKNWWGSGWAFAAVRK